MSSVDYLRFFESTIGVREITQVRGDEYKGCCPLHDDRRPSFYFNISNGVWHCKSNCGGGNAYQLAVKMNIPNHLQPMLCFHPLIV